MIYDPKFTVHIQHTTYNIQHTSVKSFRYMTQELKDRLDNDKEEDLMTHQIMTFWFKRQPKFTHDYSLVGYILSPNP